MGITGDFKTLGQMRKKLTALPGAPAKAAQALAPLLGGFVQQTFGDEKTPEGKPWKKDKPKTYALGTRSIMYRSGALFATIRAQAEGPKVRVSLGTAYLRYQLSKRSPLPKKRRTPKNWSITVRSESMRAFKEILAST